MARSEPIETNRKTRLAALAQASGAAAATPYALTMAAGAAASIVAIVLLTRLLAAQGYGLYAAITGLVLIVQNAAYLCLQNSIIRFHARAAEAEAVHRLATAVRLAFLCASAAVAAVWAAAMGWLGTAGVTAPLALAGLALVMLRGWLSLVQAWNRAEGRHWTFFTLEAVQSFGALLLAVAALELVPGSPAAAVAGAAAATLIAAACSPRLLLAPVRLRGVRPLLRELFAYGAPLALVFLASAALAVSDRLIVAVYAGAAAAGAYAVAFAIADRAMHLLLMPTPLAVKPALFIAWERGGEAAARPLLERSAYWLILLGIPAAAMLAAAPAPLARLLAGGGLADDAARAIPLLAIGSLLSCLLSLHFALAFQLARKTQWMLAAVGLPALLNVGANLLLVPRYGMMAAAWTTVACYALALLLAVLLGRRHVALPFPAKAVGLALLAAAALAVPLRLMQD